MASDSGISSGWPAPAKLNLFLHIVGRRPDGYHCLQSVFQFIDFGDELSFRVLAGPEVRRVRALPGVPAEFDLSVRAARLLQAYAGVGQGVEIAIEKQLPMGGGLGGGSSDAATTLLALNWLWRLDIPRRDLGQLALELGTDVPVFVHGAAAWAEGIGEILTPVSLPEPWFVVVVPRVAVSTPRVFKDPDLTRDSPLKTMSDFLSGGCGNDCQPVVFRQYPEVAKAAGALGRFGQARLTGTGGCVFADFPSIGEARRAQDGLRAAGFRCFTARGCNTSPLMSRLSRESGDQQDASDGP